MSVKAKTLIIITFTLLIGVVIGAMANRALLHRRIARTFSMGNPRFMLGQISRMFDLDPGKSKQFKAILDKHTKDIAEIRSGYMDDISKVMSTLDKELDPLLTPEQKAQLYRRPFGLRGLRDPGRRTPERRPREKMYPEGMRTEKRFGKELSEFQERLSLTPEQVSAVAEILAKPAIPSEGIPGPGRGGIEGWLRAWTARTTAQDREIEKLLTEKQREIYAVVKKERRQRIRDIILN